MLECVALALAEEISLEPRTETVTRGISIGIDTLTEGAHKRLADLELLRVFPFLVSVVLCLDPLAQPIEDRPI